MNINSLTNDCLILILKHFQLHELIGLREVCPHWKCVIESLFLLKRSLKLFGESADIKEYANKLHFLNLKNTNFLQLKNTGLDDDIILQPSLFTFGYCDELAELFSKVEHLVVFIGKSDSLLWNRIPYLMKLFPDLCSLSVHGLEQGGLSSRIFMAIDAMFSLTSLDISLHYSAQPKKVAHSVPFDMPELLPQLEQLSLSLYKYRGNIQAIIEQLGGKCKRLSLEWEQMTFEMFQCAFTEVNPDLADNLTHLTLRCVKGIDYLPFICANFGHLQYLSILFSSLTMIKFNADLCSNHLNRLLHLKELRIAAIHIHFAPIEKNTPLTPLTTVKILDVSALNFSSDKEFKFKPERFCKVLSTIFPNVEQITIRCNREDVIEQVIKRLSFFTKLKKHKIFADYEEHREFLGKYKNVSEDFFIKRMSFAS